MKTVDSCFRTRWTWPAYVLSIVAGFICFLNSFAQQPVEKDEKFAREIVEQADRVRFPPGGFQVDVAITNFNNGQAASARRYRVLSKGNENTVVMITEPAAERGQIILMKDRDLWVFLPNVSQPVRLALSQRLTGEVSNGDIARANFAGDYVPRMVRSEQIGNETYYVLELIAADRGVTYRRVMYWVNQRTFQPYKSEFYSLSNRLLKTCHYEDYRKMAGALRPTRLIMDDALHTGEQSVLEYSGMVPRDLPDRIFTKDYLKRL